MDDYEVPGLAEGGRVDRTGIALVHEGEYIVPAPGSEAVVSPQGSGPVVSYHFPVEIQAMGALPSSEYRRLAGRVFDRIEQELAARL